MSTQYDDMAGEEMDASEHPDNSHNFKMAGDVLFFGRDNGDGTKTSPLQRPDFTGPSANNPEEQGIKIRDSYLENKSNKVVGGITSKGGFAVDLQNATVRPVRRGGGSSGGSFMNNQ